MKTLLAVVGYFSIVRGYSQEIIKTSACDGYNETCSPSWCAAVANPACVDPLDGNEVDPSKGFQLSCKICDQSTLATCTASYLNSVF